MKVKFPKRDTLFCYESLTPSNDPKRVERKDHGLKDKTVFTGLRSFANFSLTWRRKPLLLKGFALRELVTFTPVTNLFNRFTLSQQDWFKHPIFRMRGDRSIDYVIVRVKCVKMTLIKVRFNISCTKYTSTTNSVSISVRYYLYKRGPFCDLPKR